MPSGETSFLLLGGSTPHGAKGGERGLEYLLPCLPVPPSHSQWFHLHSSVTTLNDLILYAVRLIMFQHRNLRGA